MASLKSGASGDGLLSGRDGLIGVISSWNLSRKGETGYALVLTKERVIGASRAENDVDFIAYVGEGSTATEDDRDRALAMAERILENRQFVLAKASVAQILYRHPGLLFGGYAVFKTPVEAFKVEIPVVSGWNEGPLHTSRVLLDSLIAFSPERLYDGRSGSLYVEEALKKGRGRQAGSPRAPAPGLSAPLG